MTRRAVDLRRSREPGFVDEDADDDAAGLAETLGEARILGRERLEVLHGRRGDHARRRRRATGPAARAAPPGPARRRRSRARAVPAAAPPRRMAPVRGSVPPRSRASAARPDARPVRGGGGGSTFGWRRRRDEADEERRDLGDRLADFAHLQQPPDGGGMRGQDRADQDAALRRRQRRRKRRRPASKAKRHPGEHVPGIRASALRRRGSERPFAPEYTLNENDSHY